MDSRFDAYNTHHIAPESFEQLDRHLRSLAAQAYQYQHPLIQSLPRREPGVYTIGGSRQVGKTTLLKQWMVALLGEGIPAKSIVFLTGELIDDHHMLVDALQAITKEGGEGKYWYIIIDEITYVAHWDRGIKFAVDSGILDNCIVVLTGSDLSLMQSARMTFPGRRGRASQVDFHIYSLSFHQTFSLTNPDVLIHTDDLNVLSKDETLVKKLYKSFEAYQMHGGYLTAINDIARSGAIDSATLKTYSDWVRGDCLKRHKTERYVKEVIDAILKRYNKQITWNNLSDALSIDSPKTIQDYCNLLATMDALFIQSALIEDKLVASPKKARKLTFTDPFIYHALKQWISPVADPNKTITRDVNDPLISSDLVEALVSNHYRRYFPTFYIKAAGEVDIAYINEGRFWPVEVKWRNQLRAKDIKQLKKYKHAKIFSKTLYLGEIEGIPVIPLPVGLLLPPFDQVTTTPIE